MGINNGTLINGPVWNPSGGQIDGALELDGVDDYVSLPQNAILTKEFTVSAWANHYGQGGGSDYANTIFVQRDDAVGNNRSTVYLGAGDGDGAYAQASIRSSSGSGQTLSSVGMNNNEWHHYAITVDSEDFIFYIDGEEVDRTSNNQSGDYTTSIDYVHIGHTKYEGVDSGFFNGSIDDVRIYNRSLSDQEVLELYHEGNTAPTVIYVDDSADGNNNGTSWENAYKYLQDALVVAVDGDEIKVAQGIYRPDETTVEPNGTGDREATFQLVSGVVLMGGHAGVGEVDPNDRDLELYETILSGDIGTPIDSNDNSYHIVTGSGTNATAGLDGFTITKGNSSYLTPFLSSVGGGMLNYEGSPTVLGCTFQDNRALDIYGDGMGGGVYNSNSSSRFINCKFIRNQSGWGGGVTNWGCDQALEFVNCEFIENHSTVEGGGMLNFRSSTRITNCIFRGNLASGSRYYPSGGGMSNCSYSSPIVINCIFTSNSAKNYGGGIYNVVYGSATLINCILWGNSALDGNEIALEYYSSINVDYCDVQAGLTGIYYDSSSTINWGAGNIDIDPNFVDPENNDYHLKSQAGHWDETTETWISDNYTSPCIDAGNPLTPIGWEPYPNGGVVNMGAYGGTTEASKSYFGTPPCEEPIVGDNNGDCRVDMIDFGLMALHWLEDNNI